MLAAVVFIAGLTVFGNVASTHATHGDERRYVERGRFFRYLFIERDVTRAKWGDNYWTHTQPMLANYLIGGYLWVRGYDLDSIKQREVARPAILDARSPMVLVAAASLLLMYVLVRILGGVVAGLVSALLALTSPLFQQTMIQARSEPLLVLFIVLALLGGVLLHARRQVGSRDAGWLVLTGAATGLALGSKLTAILSLATMAIWGLVLGICAVAQAERSGRLAQLRSAWYAGWVWAAVVLLALTVFVGSNPHLYSNPILHSWHLVEHRGEELLDAQSESHRRVVTSVPGRVALVLKASVIDGTATGSLGVPLEALLAGGGVMVLLVRAARGWRQHRQAPVEAFVLLAGLVYLIGVGAGLLVAWPRYFLPTLVFGILLSGLGAAVLLRQMLLTGRVLGVRTVGWLDEQRWRVSRVGRMSVEPPQREQELHL